MDNIKSPKGDTRFSKEIKSIKLKSKNNESFYYSKSPNVRKNYSYKEIVSLKNPKKSNKNDSLNQNKKMPNNKENDKKQIPSSKGKAENAIKEKKLVNIPNKGKGRSSEKLPLEKMNRNKNNKDRKSVV